MSLRSIRSAALVAGAAAVGCVGVAAPAVAQQSTTYPQLTTQLSPSKVGTPKKPQAARLKLDVKADPTKNLTLGGINIDLPKGVNLNTVGFKNCTVAQLNASGPAACPKGSLAGTGKASAFLGPQKTPLNFTLSLYTAGKNQMSLNLKGLVNIAFPVAVKPSSATGFGQQLQIGIPNALQTPVSGTFAYLNDLSADVFLKQTTKHTVKVNGKKVTTVKHNSLITTTSCPATKQLPFQATLNFVANPTPAPAAQVVQGSTPCKK